MGNQKNNIRVSHRGHVHIGGMGFKRTVKVGHQPRFGARMDPVVNAGPVSAVVSSHNPLTGGALHVIKFDDHMPKRKNIQFGKL